MKFLFLAAALCTSVVFAQLPNGEIAGAIPIAAGINPNAPGGTPGTTFSNVGEPDTLSGGLPSMCGLGANSDVFFSFTASANGTHTFATCTPAGFPAGTHTDTILQALNAGDLSALGCDDDACVSPNFASSLDVALTAGQSVYIRVATWSGTSDGSFYITVNAPVPPLNDECESASVANVGANGGTTAFASPSASPVGNCSQFGSIPDTWHLFSAPAAGDYAFSVSGAGADTLGVYDAENCGTGFDFACGSPAVLTLIDTQAVFIRVGHTSAATGTYVLTITALSPNRTLATALSVDLGVNPQPFAGFDGDVYGNFDFDPLDTNGGTIPNPSCGSGNNSDVFFSFVSPCTGSIVVETCPVPGFTIDGTHTDTVIQVLDGTGTTELACNDDVCAPGFGGSAFLSSATFAATAGQQYYIRVMSWSGVSDGTFYLTVKAPADLLTIGSGCGSGPEPTLVGSGPPAFGTTGTITVTAQPSASGAMLAAAPNLANAYFPFGACTVYLSQPGLVLLLPIATDGAGQWSLSTTFPPFDPALVCQGIDLQAILFGAGGTEMTNALRLIFGM